MGDDLCGTTRTEAPAVYAAAYLRRSSATSDSPGDASREAQAEAVHRLAAAFAPGSEVREFVDWGISGRREDRPAYVELKSAIARGEVCCVFAYSLSRLGRTARELDALFTIAEEHGVQVVTQADGTLTASSATGKFLRRILAELAELESELARERGASARLARKARHEEAGALLPGGRLPNSEALYGFRHVKAPAPSGQGFVFRREHDPAQPVAPLWDAYREAGSLRGACQLLMDRGVASPKGHGSWGSSTLARVLKAHTAPGCEHGIELPDRSASGKVRRGGGTPALFRNLLRCHCGRLMTPGGPKGGPRTYYCARGRQEGTAVHGPYTVPERRLKDALWAEVARQYRPVKPKFAERSEQAIADLTARRERVAGALLDGLITPARAKEETEAIDARLEKLNRQAGAWTGMTAADAALDLNGDPADQNAMLRRLWLRVDMDRDYRPSVQWVIDPDAARAQDEEAERAYSEPDESGESQRDREHGQLMADRFGTPERARAALRRAKRADGPSGAED